VFAYCQYVNIHRLADEVAIWWILVAGYSALVIALSLLWMLG
jgi:hypothetical protein